MIYNNYTNDAIYELERQRTLNYGADYENNEVLPECEKCGNESKSIFIINSHYVCEDCVCNALRDTFEDFEPSYLPFDIDARTIFKNITDDFTDNELISYVENLYDKL